MTHIQTPETDDAPQGKQPWTAPSLVRLDAGAAEANLFAGPDGLGETS
ncbi:MAG: hypothetical protein Q8S53_12340 [Brevundimonas sp.]|nr:hypothetical protein [Brevundimonas sp.]MDP3379142.1 hypothetical protein [Brevundimonas sp.]